MPSCAMPTRHVSLITNDAQLTPITAIGRPITSFAFADDGAIQAIDAQGIVKTIPTTGTTASTNLVVEDTGTASVATVLTLSHVLSSGTPAAGIGTGMTYYAQVTGGPIALGSTTLYTTNVGVGTVSSVFSVRTRIAGTLATRLTIDDAGDVISEGRLALRNGTAFTSTLTSTPTANRVLTLPDTTDTLVVSNDPRLLANGEMGNVCLVDQALGSDLTGARSGLPFATITAALAAALSGDCVWVMPGTYSESVTIPDGVALRGIDERSVTIQQLLVTADTTLVTMGENSHLADLALVLTSAEHHTLIAVAWPGTTTQTSLWSNSSVTVDNSTAGIGGTSNVYGCISTGSGVDVGAMIRAVLIHVNSIGGGAKRGILISGTATLHVHDFEVHVASSGGAGTYIGAETANAGASLRLHFGAAEGSTADISRTAGTLDLGNVNLVNANANALGFTAILSAGQIPMVFADSGSTPSGTRYMRTGTATVSATEQFIRIPGKTVIRSISVRALTGPGAARTDTWTVRINGVDTPVTVSLAAAATTGVTNTASAGSPVAFDLSIKQVCAASSTTSDVAVVVGLY